MGKTVPRTGAICCPCTVRTTDLGIFTMLRMVSIGNTTSCPETATRMALETSRLAGSSMRKQVPFPISLCNVYGAVQRLDAVAHDIHADAAAGYVRHLIDGGETGYEDNLEGCLFVHRGDCALGKQALLYGAALEFLGVQSLAIVLHFNHYIGAASVGREIDAADGGLALLGAVGFGLDAMVGGVADDMGERIADAVDHGLV
jgi:hypothetical protein